MSEGPLPQGPPATFQSRGFTLVELLVSLALLAVTATLLLASMTTGRGVERRAENRAVASESIAAAQNVLRDRIEAMTPETFFSGVIPITDIRGDDRAFSFTATPPSRLRPAPPQRFRIELTRAGELSLFSIDMLSTQANPLGPAGPGWSRAPLLGNVARLEIAYFGAGPPDRQRRWRDIWLDRPGPPELVRVRVAFGPGDRRVWPDLIARPATTVTALCRIDALLGRCSETVVRR